MRRAFKPSSTRPEDFDVFWGLGDFQREDLRAELEIISGNGPVFAYASVVDWRTGDPTTVPAMAGP